MPRPKIYADNAAKMRAYRARKQEKKALLRSKQDATREFAARWNAKNRAVRLQQRTVAVAKALYPGITLPRYETTQNAPAGEKEGTNA